MTEWFRAGLFVDEPDAAAEAFSCACSNGRADVAPFLLDQGVDPSVGIGTGMNAFHGSVNRGQSRVVNLLIRRGVPLGVKNSYGGTVPGAAVWAAVHETKPQHPAIIEALLRAGADYPTGNAVVDETLRKHGAR